MSDLHRAVKDPRVGGDVGGAGECFVVEDLDEQDRGSDLMCLIHFSSAYSEYASLNKSPHWCRRGGT